MSASFALAVPYLGNYGLATPTDPCPPTVDNVTRKETALKRCHIEFTNSSAQNPIPGSLVTFSLHPSNSHYQYCYFYYYDYFFYYLRPPPQVVLWKSMT
ncbi:hypothetical protein GX48_07729 [Paracoccidioides brasiliensis]|nr:hypothetical protein GX48_07729 [Paracoccidioides brasiliensis]